MPCRPSASPGCRFRYPAPPSQPGHDALAHHEVPFAALQPRHLLGEGGDALAVGAGKARDVRAPEGSLGAEGFHDAAHVAVQIAPGVGVARIGGQCAELDCHVGQACKGEQIEKYFIPYANGEKKSAIAITEPGAGSDPAGMKTRAEYKNGKWIINGQKIFISNARQADFIIVMAVTDPAKGSRGGITAFLVDKGTKGLSIPTVLNTIGEHAPYGVYFDDVEVPEIGRAHV